MDLARGTYSSVHVWFHLKLYDHYCLLICLVRMELPYVVLWRPEALDCRVPIPPEAWNGLAEGMAPAVWFPLRSACLYAKPLTPGILDAQSSSLGPESSTMDRKLKL